MVESYESIGDTSFCCSKVGSLLQCLPDPYSELRMIIHNDHLDHKYLQLW